MCLIFVVMVVQRTHGVRTVLQDTYTVYVFFLIDHMD